MLLEYAKTLKGIEVHGGSIRIRFTYQGIERRETLKGVKLTKANLKFAFNKRAVVLHEIATGQFDYLEHFPESKSGRLFCEVKRIPSVAEALEIWLSIKKTKVRAKTANNYRNDAANHILPNFGNRKLNTITYSEVEAWRSKDLGHLSNKTINEICIPLRGAFSNAVADRVIDHNPMDHVHNLNKGTPDNADPFELSEIKLLTDCETYKQSEQNGFIFACWSGLRVSEWVALAWEDVDLLKKQVSIKRSVVKGRYAYPKTKGSQRTLDLLEPAYDALVKQKQLTMMMKPFEIQTLQEDNRKLSKESLRFVFLDSLTNGPYKDGQNLQEKFFKHFLQQNNIRHRGVNQARHTYASQLITAGVAERWIAKQMGHTSIAMLEKHYGRWMDAEMPNMASDVSKLFQNRPTDAHRKLI
jgi:integrase